MEGGPVPAEAGEAEQVGPPGKRRGCPSDPRCSNPHMRHKQRMGLSVISFAAGRPNMWADLLVKGRHASLLAIRSGDSGAREPLSRGRAANGELGHSPGVQLGTSGLSV